MNPSQTIQTQLRPNRFRRWLAVSVLISFGLTTPAAMAVGYVNVVLTNGYTFVANPLSTPPNQLTNIIWDLPTGSRAYFWDAINQVFLPPATFGELEPGKWDLNYDLPVGRGVVLYMPVKWTNTFVGDVLLGNLTNHIAGNNGISLVGSKVPQLGPISSTLSFPLLDGATVHFFRSPSQTFSGGYTCFTNFGWFDPQTVGGTNDPQCMVAESFVVQNPGPPTNWVRNFTEITPLAESDPQTDAVIIPIDKLTVSGGMATLQWADQPGQKYEVQFSTDGDSWITVDGKAHGGKWTGPLPDPVQGRFRIAIAQAQGGGQ
jgi:hypothetical protein